MLHCTTTNENGKDYLIFHLADGYIRTSQDIAEMRREIESIQELAATYRAQKSHRTEDQVAHITRMVRLKAIRG
jgi:hypothetical protein